jgi:hypothetical protein
MFGQPIDALLSPWLDQGGPPTKDFSSQGAIGVNNKEVLEMAAQRARRFALGTSASNLTGESMDQLHDDVAMLAVTYQQQPLSTFLGQLVETQDTLFTLLEGRQPPAYTRRLLLLAGVTGGLLAKVSHDLAQPHAALTQSRTAFLCAENADHNGIRAWIRGIQSLVAYWAGRYHESLRYAQQGAQYAPRNTTAVWLPVSEARAWAALGNATAAREAIHRAEDAREQVQPDEVDELGGLCTFSHNRQLYYAAETLAWLPTEAHAAERYALQAVAAYSDTGAPEWGFGDSAGAATDLAVARVWLGEVEGASDALQPVLALPPEQRINGIVLSVNHVHSALTKAPASAATRDLQEQIEVFAATPISAIPR